jgi:hypothetical protein
MTKWQGGGARDGGEAVSVPGIRESLDFDGHVRLRRWFARAAAEGVTGRLRVSGSPGGVLQFSDGLVVAAESSGAPGVQALLVRAGRVSDEDWARDGGADHAAAAAYVGPAHGQVLRLMANQDALFAMLAGSIGTCSLEHDPDGPPGDQGQDAAALLADTLRKLDALALLPRAILPHRDRLLAPSTGPSGGVSARGPAGPRSSEIRRAILGYADGRRTARDIAFVSGRSLYAVTVEMSRMLDEGLLHEPQPASGPVDPSSGPMVPRNPPPAPPAGAQPIAARSELPRRRPPADGGARDPTSQKTAASWRDFLHFGGRAGDRD